jgi:hypothetical protein
LPGKHEPASNRSFFLSLATTTLRALILVAAVALGAVMIGRAFPEGGSHVIRAMATPSATPSPHTRRSSRPSPRVRGVVVLVLNGTNETGLAGEYTTKLENLGYSKKVPGNAPLTSRTTIYYRKQFVSDARYIRKKLFRVAVLKPAPSTVDPTVDVEVIIGNDFLGSRP